MALFYSGHLFFFDRDFKRPETEFNSIQFKTSLLVLIQQEFLKRFYMFLIVIDTENRKVNIT